MCKKQTIKKHISTPDCYEALKTVWSVECSVACKNCLGSHFVYCHFVILSLCYFVTMGLGTRFFKNA